MNPGLHARTVALAYGPDALQFDAGPTTLFDRPGLTLVGWGTALLVTADAAAAALVAIPCDDQVQCPGSGPVALGALPFLDTAAGSLVIPRFSMGIARDPDGVTRRWATAIGPDDVALPDTDELFESVIWQYGEGSDVSADPAVIGLETPVTVAACVAMVRDAVVEMRRPGATLRKVVLSRPVSVHLDGPLPLASSLRRLRAAEPDCTIFSMPVPEGTFFGASPELLVARHGDRVTCHPLAGTVRRGDTARADARAQRDLADSPKSRAEHRYVVEDIAHVLAGCCDRLTVPDEPALVAFRSLAHLGTRIEGRLSRPLDAVDLMARLHPTPAVGGSPRPEALAAIAALEGIPRGPWAGPVGWTDARGDGEWMIGIRSVLLLEEATALGLRAGAGVVVDSDPEAEAAEIDVKLASVLDAVVPGVSARLR